MNKCVCGREDISDVKLDDSLYDIIVVHKFMLRNKVEIYLCAYCTYLITSEFLKETKHHMVKNDE